MSKVICTELQKDGASGANITLDTSKNVTCENNLTVDGTTTLTGAVTLPSDTVDEATLKISNAGSNGEFLSKQSGDTGGLTWAAAGGGITMAESWSLTANFDHAASPSGTTDDVTANWGKQNASTTLIGNIGSSMTESSGIFTFPSTGYYMITVDFQGKCTSSTDSEYHGTYQNVSSNSGGAWTQLSESYTGASFSQQNISVTNTIIVDVTNASTFRWKVEVVDDQDATWYGTTNGTKKACGVTFVRLADT